MSLTELSIGFPCQNQVVVKFENEKSEALAFESPVTKKDLEDLRWYIEVYAAQYTGEPDDEEAKRIEEKLITLGEKLFNVVFAEKSAKDLFEKFHQQSTDRLLTINTDIPEILSLPWELLREPQNTFLFQHQPRISIRRYCVKSNHPSFTIQAKAKLRLLFIVSRPVDASFLDPRLDAQAVMDALAKSDISQIEIEFLRPATLKKLTERLENKNLPLVDIIHFDGHGGYNEKEQLGYLFFENSPAEDSRVIGDPTVSRKHAVSSALLSKKLVPHNIALMVLSACQSAMIGNQALGSVAAGLTNKGVPTVLAMVYSVLVQTTRQLFTSFYQQIAMGEGIGAALDSARQQMTSQSQRGIKRRGEDEFELTLQDWFVPALYSTGQDDVLLQNNAPKIEKTALCHNLPSLQAKGFFGRSWELWQIEHWFVQGIERITITGFGGQGKTYLAIEAAHWLLQTDLFDAVCFVDFSRYSGADALRYAMNALGVLLETTLLDENAVPPLLQTRRLLWVWDNLESLAAETLEELLTVAVQWSAQCHFLFTTRQYRFTHTDYADYNESNFKHRYVDLTGLAELDALAYFNQLWQTSPLPEQSYPARYELIALFSKVAFHPLSISLLAQQLKTRTIEELGEHLEALLLCVPEDSKNKSLLASLELSLNRLSCEERELIKCLGIFQGGTWESMIEPITEITTSEWVILRPALENTGLIQIEDLNNSGINVPYLKFHPILAPYLWQELTATQQEALLARYRKNYYQLSGFLYFEDQKNSNVPRIVALRELPNLLHAAYAALHASETFAVEFASYVDQFLYYFGWQRDRRALATLIQQEGAVVSSDWFLTQRNQGIQLFDSGQYVQAEKIFQEIIGYLDKTPSYNLSITLANLANCFLKQGNTADAIKYYQQGLNVAQQLESSIQHQRLIYQLHSHLADAYTDNGDYNQAKSYYDVIKGINDVRGEAVRQQALGSLAIEQGDLEEAEKCYRKALEMANLLNEPTSKATILHLLGRVYQEAKAWTQAEKTYRESADISEAHSDLAAAAMAWHELAMVTEAQGKWETAERWYCKAIKIKRLGNSLELAHSLNNLAKLLQNQSIRLSEARQLAEEALEIKKHLDEAIAELWTTYELLAQIADKQQNNAEAKKYRHLSHESYLHFSGMLYQLRQYAPLIAMVISAVLQNEQPDELKQFLVQLPDDWKNAVKAFQNILNGERNEAILIETLAYTDAAIVHLILKGINNPENLETLFNS